MKLSQFDRRVIETCLNQCKVAIILLAVFLLLLVIEIIYYRVTKNNNGLSFWTFFPIFKSKLTTKEQIGLDVIAVLALLVWIGFTIVPAFKDVSNQQYECISGKCTYEKGEQKKMLASNGRIRVETKEDVLFLEIPADLSVDAFFDGTVQGQICYSRESRILLSLKIE